MMEMKVVLVRLAQFLVACGSPEHPAGLALTPGQVIPAPERSTITMYPAHGVLVDLVMPASSSS